MSAEGRTSPEVRTMDRAILIGALVLWALVNCFNRLGVPPVYTTNEAREGVYVRAMLDSGNLVAPVVPNHLENGELIPDKPPLFHWLSAAATWLRGGRFDEWALRFPSALGAVVMVFAVALGGASLVGERAAILAAAVLLTSFQFSYQARLGRVDMIFACCVTVAVLAAGRAIVGRRPRSLVLAAAAAALAVLAKGPLGLVLPALGCGAFLLAARPAEGFGELPWRKATLTFLAIALPWYLASSWVTGGASFRSQLIAENFDQFTGGNGRMRFGLYLRPWLLDSLPWNLVALFALFEVWRRRDAGPRFCAIVWLTILAVFQIAAYKRRAYLLPALPLEAMLAGWLLDVKLGAVHDFSFARPPLLVAGGLVRATLVTILAAVGGLWLVSYDVALAVAGVAVIVLALAAAVRAIRAGDRWSLVCASFVALGGFYVAIYPAALEVFAREISAKSLVQRIDQALPSGETLHVCGVGEDPSLVVLLYFRDPSRISMIRDEPTCRHHSTAGFYLLSAEDWRRARGQREQGRALWVELFSGELKGKNVRSTVVFAERRIQEPP